MAFLTIGSSQLPVFDILDFVIHAHIALVSRTRYDATFYSLYHLTALLAKMVAGVEFAGAEIAVKLGKSKLELILAYQLKAFDINGGKTRSICYISAVLFEKLNGARGMSASAELIADLSCLQLKLRKQRIEQGAFAYARIAAESRDLTLKLLFDIFEPYQIYVRKLVGSYTYRAIDLNKLFGRAEIAL